jgi:ferredoxin-NADP reductase
MYKLVLYFLVLSGSISVLLAFLGRIPYPALSVLLMFAVIPLVCRISNHFFAKFFDAAYNTESATITGLILFFILIPPQNLSDFIFGVLTAIFAMASKYFLAINKKHIFNPAAIALFIMTLWGVGISLWWVGTPYLLPVMLLGGLLVVRKVRKFGLFLTFLGAALAALLAFGIKNGRDPIDVLSVSLLSYPVIFFGTIMLTEPSTLPPTRKLQIIYAALVGFLFGSQFSLGPITSSPETALVAGNIFSFAFSLKKKLILELSEKREIAKGAYEFVFDIKNKFSFAPGQFLEWTLAGFNPDFRGNRRYFTIASSPTENKVKLGVRFYDRPSKFKEKLLSLEKGSKVTAGNLAGDFTLPEDSDKKLVFIAGGIGITPFVSMLKFLIDKNQKRRIILFDINKTPEEIPYKNFLSEAQKKLGVNVIHILTEVKELPSGLRGETGHINSEIIRKYVPGIKENIFYVSGSNSVVNAVKQILSRLGVTHTNIVTDYFPGL